MMQLIFFGVDFDMYGNTRSRFCLRIATPLMFNEKYAAILFYISVCKRIRFHGIPSF